MSLRGLQIGGGGYVSSEEDYCNYLIKLGFIYHFKYGISIVKAQEITSDQIHISINHKYRCHVTVESKLEELRTVIFPREGLSGFIIISN